jgi:uncharacterized protein (UPF0276 family)
LPALGAGLGFREPLKAGVFRHRPSIGALEITVEHYLDASPEKADELDLLRGHLPLIPHGLELSLGSAEGIDPRRLERYAALIENVRPPWWSEHVAFTAAAGVEIGHLAPVPFTREALDVLSANLEAVRRMIPSPPLILENITYTLDWGAHEMSEAEFLGALCRESGCGLLLDVTNLWLNARRHGYEAAGFLDALPLDHVVQLHFVGAEKRGEEWVDSHGRKTSPEIFELLRAVVERAPVKAAILERDKDFPPFAETLEEVETAARIGREAGRWS